MVLRDGDVEMRQATPDAGPEAEDPGLSKAVGQLHVNLGHPHNTALARAIRLAGGSDAAIMAALKLRCSICDRFCEPSSVLPASIRKWREFGECVAIDLFSLGDSTGKSAIFLNML